MKHFVSDSFYPTKLDIFSQVIMNQHNLFKLKYEKSVSKKLVRVRSSLDETFQRTKLSLTPWSHNS